MYSAFSSFPSLLMFFQDPLGGTSTCQSIRQSTHRISADEGAFSSCFRAPVVYLYVPVPATSLYCWLFPEFWGWYDNPTLSWRYSCGLPEAMPEVLSCCYTSIIGHSSMSHIYTQSEQLLPLEILLSAFPGFGWNSEPAP